MSKKIQRSSTNAERHPYMKLSFWENPSNQFWLSDTHSDKSKDHFNDWINEWRSKERVLTSL